MLQRQLFNFQKCFINTNLAARLLHFVFYELAFVILRHLQGAQFKKKRKRIRLISLLQRFKASILKLDHLQKYFSETKIASFLCCFIHQVILDFRFILIIFCCCCSKYRFIFNFDLTCLNFLSNTLFIQLTSS